MKRDFHRIGVMCGSSQACNDKYLQMANRLGRVLAQAGLEVIYGGGAKGLMRQVADGALAENGKVHGYIPSFMTEVEWQHPSLTNLHITSDMAERKFKMMHESDATIFLPGGSGTMEEFFEWLSAKRLGKYIGPLVLVNFQGYYDPLIELLKRMEIEKFHNPIHSQMWSVCTDIDQIIHILETAPTWSEDSIHYASVSEATEAD